MLRFVKAGLLRHVGLCSARVSYVMFRCGRYVMAMISYDGLRCVSLSFGTAGAFR